ncbi:hypothetical protein HHI36_010933 [Cryptolaemus montrouzieri]|uniref:Uncharacterized protein n=1 Tax=Cryptolaemus montrouzieri TaxID=559131 RepID=A0ABD2MK89_9CUCU
MSKDKKSSLSSLQKRSLSNLSKLSRDIDRIDETQKIEERPEHRKDFLAIEIILDTIENVKTLHQTCFVHVKSEYNGNVLDISEKILVIDGNVKMNWSFYIDIDTCSDKEMDNLVSKPIMFTVYQSQGEFDTELFAQMQLFDDIVASDTKSFDSAISVYEAFTGEVVEDKEYLKEKKKEKLKKVPRKR